MAAYEEFQRFSSDAKMRDLEHRRRQFLDEQRLYASAHKKEGRVEGITEVARNMKLDGADLDTIVKYTGLSLQEIEGLN